VGSQGSSSLLQNLSGADEVIRQWGVMATHHSLEVFKALWRSFLCNPNIKIICSIKKGDQTSFFT
jgi:hypothetical protein